MDQKAKEYIASLHEKSKNTHLKDTWYCIAVGIIYGIPRVINAFRALIKALPSEESNEISSIRNHISVPAETDETGIAYMRNIFRADLDPFLGSMDKYWPDLRTLVVTYIYGYYQSDTSILDAITTSQLNIATLVPMDVTAEVAWHMRGTIRNGGTEEQLNAAYEIALEICDICQVQLKNEMPKAEDVVNEERLIVD
ncbi:fungal [Fusarium albosuccineum]|uniref:Fungal n=1 Tax=Fusarium albosuccineum TaxID=1237068 RepID=A0A8H4L2V3_9HYPO|nr:fungal [Fusarium albosuccineum]